MKEILDAAEVADLLGCDESTVEEKARAGELPGVKFGRPWRFPAAALLQVLNAQALANKPKPVAPAAVVKKQKPRRQPPRLVSLDAPLSLRL